MTRTKFSFLALFSLFLASTSSNADVIVLDFEGLEHGRIVDTQLPGVTVTADNDGGGPDIAVAFNSNLSGTSDPDLERGSGWSAGNLASNTDLGNVLILQENSNGIADGIADDPDDEGSRPAGWIQFDLDTFFTALGFDLIDIEGTSANDEPGSVDIMLGGAVIFSVSFMDLVGVDGVVFGNNSANQIQPISGFGTADGVRFNLGGSGAIDNLRFYTVPEPGPLALLGIGLLGMAAVRRRRKS